MCHNCKWCVVCGQVAFPLTRSYRKAWAKIRRCRSCRALPPSTRSLTDWLPWIGTCPELRVEICDLAWTAYSLWSWLTLKYATLKYTCTCTAVTMEVVEPVRRSKTQAECAWTWWWQLGSCTVSSGFQCQCSRFLKELTLSADRTEFGKLFHADAILLRKMFSWL